MIRIDFSPRRGGKGARAAAFAFLVGVALAVASGCGGTWKGLPPDAWGEGTRNLGAEWVRLTLDDGRVFQMRVLRVEHPFLWGERFLGERMPAREIRIDLRNVTKIEARAD